MRSSFLLFPAILCAALAPSASAEMRQIAPGRYDCRAPAGHYETVDVSSFLDTSNSIAARFRFVSADFNPDTPASAALVYQLDNGETATIVVAAYPDSDLLYVGLKPPGSNQLHVMATTRRSRIVELSATWIRGAIFARFGNERGQINVQGRRLVRREVMCSSGRFEIELTRNPRPPRRV